MSPRPAVAGLLSALVFRLRSVPLFLKVVGISGVVAAIFAGITLVLTHACMSGILYQLLEQRAISTSESLGVSLENPMSTADVIAVKRKIHRTQHAFSDVRYVIVRDPAGQIVASTFGQEVPSSLQRVFSPGDSYGPRIQTPGAREGRVLDVVFPILAGHAGTLQLGMLDEMVRRARGGR